MEFELVDNNVNNQTLAKLTQSTEYFSTLVWLAKYFWPPQPVPTSPPWCLARLAESTPLKFQLQYKMQVAGYMYILYNNIKRVVVSSDRWTLISIANTTH